MLLGASPRRPITSVSGKLMTNSTKMEAWLQGKPAPRRKNALPTYPVPKLHAHKLNQPEPA